MWKEKLSGWGKCPGGECSGCRGRTARGVSWREEARCVYYGEACRRRKWRGNYDDQEAAGVALRSSPTARCPTERNLYVRREPDTVRNQPPAVMTSYVTWLSDDDAIYKHGKTSGRRFLTVAYCFRNVKCGAAKCRVARILKNVYRMILWVKIWFLFIFK